MLDIKIYYDKYMYRNISNLLMQIWQFQSQKKKIVNNIMLKQKLFFSESFS